MHTIDTHSLSFGNPLAGLSNDELLQPAPGVDKDYVYRCCCKNLIAETLSEYYTLYSIYSDRYGIPRCNRCMMEFKLRSRN